ncbi:MAG: hypothetical protein OXH28_06640 [bacterium]|nr:hypothetical protein [bacterium]
MHSEPAAAPTDVTAGTVAGPDGAVPVGEVSIVRLITKGTKSHTCAACGSPIAKGDSSLLAHGGGRQWRLCTNCAPEAHGGYPLAWGRPCEWRASEVGTVERRATRRYPYYYADLRYGSYVTPWEGTGWDWPPVTPEQREATAQQERAHREAFRKAAQQRDREWARDNAAAESARQERCRELCDIVCQLAAGHAARSDGHDRDNLETAAKALIPDVVTSFDLHAEDHGLSVEDATELIMQIAWESARKGYEIGFPAGARAQSERPAGQAHIADLVLPEYRAF